MRFFFIFEVCKNQPKMTKVRHLGGQRQNPAPILGGPAECAGAPGGVLGGLEILVKLVKLEIGQKVFVI